MKQLITGVLALFFALPTLAQDLPKTDFNFDLENTVRGAKLPIGYGEWGKDYLVATDSAVSHSGKKSVLMQKTAPDAPFGSVYLKIPAVYKGKVIELKGWLKLEGVANGFAGLLLRQDGMNGVLGFDNMKDRKLAGTAGWQQYSIKMPLDKNARTIYVGALNTGSGKVWVDGLQVLINGKDISKAGLKPESPYKADKDTAFDAGSGIPPITLTPQKTEDLYVMGLVWGYLKYYHPAVAAGNYNWDYELFRILPKVLAAQDPQQRDDVLYQWITGLGGFKPGKPKVTEDAKLLPDLAWMETCGFADHLKKLLVSLKDARRSKNNYYVAIRPNIGNPEFKNEQPYRQMDYADAGYRVLSLYRYWNIIQYFFPYKNLIEEDWKAVLKEFVPKFVNAADETQYKVAVLELIARVHDTHANIWSTDNALSKFKGARFPAAEASFVEGQALVSGYYDDALGKKTGLEKGDIIATINGKKVADVVAERLKYTPASNYPTQLRDIAHGLLRTNDSVINIEYLRGGQPYSKSLDTYDTDKINVYSTYQKKDTCFKFLTPKIAYLYPGTVKYGYLKTILKEIENTDGLVIDLRCYPSAFIVFSVGDYLSARKNDFVKFSNGSVTAPGQFTFKKPFKVGGKSNYYKGKVIVLVNETTQSQAEYTTMAFRAAGAVVVGSVTAAADGNVSEFMLPGGLRSMISGIGVYYPDGKETQRIGIVPDVEVKPTVAGVQAGKDEVLDKAIELINNR